MRAIRVLLIFVLLGLASAPWQPAARAQAGALRLGLTVNTQAIVPGDTLVAGITVDNPGGGPLADFYFLILLPDGTTVVSAGPGVVARVGTVGDLRSLVPVAQGVSLAQAFPYQSSSFFSYTFSGIEPLGLYRLFFAAVRAGGLNDGVLGAGDLLAVASRDVTVTNSPIVVDPLRTITRTITPSGGVVQTTSANGTLLTLTVPAGAVRVATPISITPIVAFGGRPGPVVAGISAGPSGLRLSPPATLTIALPPGFQSSGFGLRGVVSDDNGRHLEFLPVKRVGNVVTVTVSHFSAIAIEVIRVFDEWACTFDASSTPTPERVGACATIGTLADAEFIRLERDGGPISQAFKDSIVAVLDVWLTNGLLPRLLDAQTPTPGDPFGKKAKAKSDWSAWISVYEPLFGLADRANQGGGRPLGAKVDLAQERFRLALVAAMNSANILCLAQKERVDSILLETYFLVDSDWNYQFQELPSTAPFELVYCVDLRIDAAPPPVLTPGQAALFPVDVRLRFTDGVELPGRLAAVSVSATNGTVTPAGGVVTLPLASNLTLLPTATSSTVTITAAAVDRLGTVEGLVVLPTRTRTFQAGQSGTTDIVLTRSSMFARARANLPNRPTTTFVTDSTSTFAPTQSVSAVMNESETVGQAIYRATTRSSHTRTVDATAVAVTVTGSGSQQPALTVQNPPAFQLNASTAADQGPLQTTCFNVTGRFVATYSVQTNSSVVKRPGSNLFVAFVQIGDESFSAPGSGSLFLDSGERCITFFTEEWSCASNNVGVVSCFTPNPLSWSYTVTLRPAP